MAARQTRELYLSITGNADGVGAASKAGRTALLSLSSAAIDVKAEVEKAFADMGASAPAQAKQIERSYTKTFDAIRANAKAVLDQPTQGGALTVLNAGAAEQAASAAENQAAALRQVATAAAAVAQRAGEAGAAERVLAVASEANAQQAEREAVALRGQANVLGMVRSELQANGVVQRVITTRNEQQRQSTIMLGQQLQDFSVQVVSGQSVVTAFSQQIGQAAFAVQGMGGKMEAVAGFLTSGWGIAATVGVTVLLPLIAKVLEHGDALQEETKQLKENAEKSAIADQAKQAFLQTTAGAIDDVRQLTEEIKKQNDALLTNAERLNIRSKLRLETLADRRGDVAQQLVKAREAQRAANSIVSGGVAGGSSVMQGQADSKVRELEATLRAVDKAIADANAARLATQKDLSDEAAKRAIDPLEEIKRRYEGPNGLIALEKRNATAAEVTNGVLTRRLALLRTKQTSEIETERQRQSDAKQKPSAAAEASAGDMTALLKAILPGVRITATTNGKHVPGSDHYKDRAIDFVPEGGMGSMTKAQVREALVSAGVRIRRNGSGVEQLFGPGDRGHSDHFHVAWQGGVKSTDDLARAGEAQQRKVEAAEQKRIRDAEAYAQLLGGAQAEQLRLERNRTLDISAAADLDAAAVKLERERLDSAVQAGVAQKRWSQEQAEAVKLVNAANATMKTDAVRKAQGMALLDQQLDADRDALGRSSALLQLQADLETTNGGRRAIAMRLLANDEAEQRARAVKLIGSDNPADWARGESMLRDIEDQRPLRTAQIDRQYAGPMDRYRQQLDENVGDTNVALQGVKVNALRGLEDGLMGILDGTESVAGGFRKMTASILSDLARIAIQKMVLSVIGLKDGGEVLHLAGGGEVFGPGGPREDRVPAMLSAGEYVINAAAYARHPELVQAINTGKLPGFADGGLVSPSRIFMRSLPSAASIAPRSSAAPIVFDLRHAVTTEQLMMQMQQIAAQHAGVSMVAGSQMAQADIADHQYQTIPQ